MNSREYNQCVDEHADAVYRFILKNIRDEEKAKDIVQDSFEKMWLRHTEVDRAKAKSYLFTTAYHTMIDNTRRDSRQTRFEEVHMNLHRTENQYSDLREVLDCALTQLPDIQRSVIMLRDYEGYSYEEIGQITGLNESQVKVYIFRARMTLKNYIGKLENVI
jgi:RNA polymerase sigma factor (sigma-70 family)